MILAKGDPVGVAKALHVFARTNQALVIKAGVVEGQVLEADGLKALKDLDISGGVLACGSFSHAGDRFPVALTFYHI